MGSISRENAGCFRVIMGIGAIFFGLSCFWIMISEGELKGDLIIVGIVSIIIGLLLIKFRFKRNTIGKY